MTAATATRARTVTRTRQPDPIGFTTTALIAALEAAWAAIQTRHPEVPTVVLVLGAGSPRKAADNLTYGHFATSKWQHGDTQIPEVMISGEGLQRPAAEVLTTLLHEAAHGIADIRKVQDTSRQGRWHNKKFATIANELGLDVANDRRIGWSVTSLQPATAAAYEKPITQLGAAMSAYRRLDVITTATRTNNNNGISAECACPRKIRVSTSVFEEGPIWCGVCETPFHNPDAEDPDNADTGAVDGDDDSDEEDD